MRKTASHFETLLATFESLLRYVNRRVDIIQGEVELDTEEGIISGQLVARHVWSHPEIIDDYLREKGGQLPHACLEVAAGFKDALYGGLYLERIDADSALIVHESGAYRVCQPWEGFFEAYRHAPLELRGALVPCGEVIVAIPPLVVLGDGDDNILELMHEDLDRLGNSKPTSSAREFVRNVRSWRARGGRNGTDAGEPRDINALGKGFHRGPLAGMGDEERARVLRAYRADSGWHAKLDQGILDMFSVDADIIPETLEEALLLLDDEWLVDVACGLEIEDLPRRASKHELVRLICKDLAEHPLDMDIPLTWCLDEQFELIGRLLDTNPIVLDNLPPDAGHPCPMAPFVFLVRAGKYLAWMPPEIRAQISRSAYESARRTRERLADVQAVARGLATMCGVITVSDVYERYRKAVTRPLDRQRFDRALAELETHGFRDDYALWRHNGTDYVISVELADESAPAHVTRECFADHIIDGAAYGVPEDTAVVGIDEQDAEAFSRLVAQARKRLERIRLSLLCLDRHLPPHDLLPGMLEDTPVEALMRTDPIRAIRSFVDAHIPDGENDYTFADTFARAIVISTVLLSDNYNATIDLIRLYQMQHCDGTGYSDTLGRLVTNAYNALPRWELNGWSLEENTQRITGRKRFFNPNGTAMELSDDDPCPCGSAKPYGSCCGRVT